MIPHNPNMERLHPSYLFTEMTQKVAEYTATHPSKKIHRLGIGDTTIPFSDTFTTMLASYVKTLSTEDGYEGYQSEQGSETVRTALCSRFYPSHITSGDLFLSDGAKCDIGRLQILVQHLSPVLIQDPTYPVYRDGTLLHGKQEIHYAPCTPDNDFFPDVSSIPKLLYLCSPNNPTGTALSFSQLEELVAFAQRHGILIIYDAAYRFFIQNGAAPQSIYEIPGAEEVAIEVNSFSKFAGFTGVRLGWVVVPKALGTLHAQFRRLHATIFNGASLLAQKGGSIILDACYDEARAAVASYTKNTSVLRTSLLEQGYTVYGGIHAPYVWVQKDRRTSSWALFDHFLTDYGIVGTPGIGFGPSGESFVRLSGFFHPSQRDVIRQLLTGSHQLIDT